MEIKELSKKDLAIWDQFTDESNNGTLFHKMRFLSYHPKERFDFQYLAFYKNSHLVALLPGAVNNDVYKSPAGASYGSFATNTLSFSEYEELIDTFLMYMKTKVKKVYLTPPPIVYSKELNQLDQFILGYKGFKVEQQLISHAVNVASFSTEVKILSRIKKRFRNDVTKALRNKLSVEINNEYDAFYAMLVENKKRFQSKPTHSLKDLIKLSKLVPDSMKLFMAYDENKVPIAGVLLFVANQSTILVFYICQNYDYQEKNAVNLLLYEAVSWSKKNRYNWFDLGVSMDTSSSNPMEPSRNLIFFKEGLHSLAFLRTTYVYEY